METANVTECAIYFTNIRLGSSVCNFIVWRTTETQKSFLIFRQNLTWIEQNFHLRNEYKNLCKSIRVSLGLHTVGVVLTHS